MSKTREIKFRAWDGERMHKAFDLTQNPLYWWQENYDYPLMQYTGLKDKNGVEIYEGDILRNATEKLFGCLKFEIRWENRSGRFVLDSSQEHGWHGLDATTDDSNEYLEVIGNIYENPELLNG